MNKAKSKNLLVRTLSGLMLLGVVMAAVLISPVTFALLLLLICAFAMYEFYGLAEKKGVSPMKQAGLGLAFLLLIANFASGDALGGIEVPLPLIVLVVILGVFVLFAMELFRKKANPIANIGVTLGGIVYVAVPLLLLWYISILPVPGEAEDSFLYDVLPYNPWVVLCYIFVIWMNDIGAYLVGVTWGRHRLFERISPKKSWEGFFGGLIFGVGTGIAAGYAMGQSLFFWGGLALTAVVSGVIGDLVESMFKRSAGVKDSGNIMPGHGGMLDRFDALIFSVPFVFVYFIIFAMVAGA